MAHTLLVVNYILCYWHRLDEKRRHRYLENAKYFSYFFTFLFRMNVSFETRGDFMSFKVTSGLFYSKSSLNRAVMYLM